MLTSARKAREIAAAPSRAAPVWRGRGLARERYHGLLFIGPAFLLLAGIVVFPLGWAMWTSLFRTRGLRSDFAGLTTTPTIRLLEIACGLNRTDSESLIATHHDARPRHAFPDRPSELNAYQAFGVVLCGLLLSSIVAAVIVSLA